MSETRQPAHETDTERGSMTAYARHRKKLGLPGQTHVAVKKAIDSGRIEIADDGKIAFAAADRQWEANTRRRQTPLPAGRQAEQPNAAPAAASGPAAGPLPEPLPAGAPQLVDGVPWQVTSAAELNKRRNYWASENLRVEMARTAGDLVEARTVAAAFQTRARALRDKLLALPNRLRQPLAAESDPHQVQQTLRRELAQTLEEFIQTELGVSVAEAQNAA